MLVALFSTKTLSAGTPAAIAASAKISASGRVQPAPATLHGLQQGLEEEIMSR